MDSDNMPPPPSPGTQQSCKLSPGTKQMNDSMSFEELYNSSANNNINEEDMSKLWTEWMSCLRSGVLEEVEVVGGEGAVVWAALEQEEVQLEQELDILLSQISNFKQECITEVDSLIESLQSAISCVTTTARPSTEPNQQQQH